MLFFCLLLGLGVCDNVCSELGVQLLEPAFDDLQLTLSSGSHFVCIAQVVPPQKRDGRAGQENDVGRRWLFLFVLTHLCLTLDSEMARTQYRIISLISVLEPSCKKNLNE